MKVAIVHDFLVRFGWAERVLGCFMEMFPDSKIHTLFYDEKKMSKFFPKNKVVCSSLQFWYKLLFWRYTLLLSKMPKAIEEFDFSSYDLVIWSSAAFSHWIITNTNTKFICYIHSPMRWAWDYYFEFQKERKFWFFRRLFFSKKIHKIRIWDYICKDRPDKIIAASNLIQRRIEKFWRKESELIYPFVDIGNFYPGNKKEIKDPYYLVVSQLVPYKKIDQIINAFNEFWEKLLIVWTWCEEVSLKKQAKDNIEFVWAKYGKDLLSLYQNAKAFIFAWIDDFWITPIEAMACWIPVIAIKAWAVVETVIDGKTWYFYDEQTADSLLERIKTCDLTKIKKEDCVNRAEKFSKKIFVEKIMNLTS